MSAPLTTESLPALTDGQRKALLSLLTDEDAAVYHAIRKKIIAYGPSVTLWLRPHLLSPEASLRRRAQEIVDYFSRQDSDTEFLAFCLKQGEEFELEAAMWLLARTQFPNINVAAYRAILDSFADHLREKIDLSSRAESTLAGINQFLFAELNFSGNEKNYYEPDNSYLNRVIDRRTGNPISLCIVYFLIARRLRLPISGVGLPGHFICRYQSSTDEFYIDPFNKGKLLTKADCIKYLIQTNHSLLEGHLAPLSARRILLRVCANLHQVYTQSGAADETSRVQRYIVALAK